MPTSRSLLRAFASALVLVTALGWQVAAATMLFVGTATPAAASTDEEELKMMRDHWQDKYRTLLQNRARLQDDIAKSKKNYAQAQRRNYPRGGAREQFLIQAQESEKALEETEREIAAIFVDARKDEIPPGWLYEVEDEPIDLAQPAAPDNATDTTEEDREGRNPIYFEDDEDEDDS